MTKSEVYTEIFNLLNQPNGDGTIKIDTILLPMCDYFNGSELEGFLNHLKEERES